MKLCFATNNSHKIEEVTHALQSAGGTSFEIASLQAIGCHAELPETQETLEGNARQKAQYVWDNFGVSCFADDTGLEVTALGGEPGVHSAHYAGPQRNAADNMALVLSKLAGHESRQARFRTVISLIIQGQAYSFEGQVEGVLLNAPRGEGGFGYDPIFVPNGYEETFSEMPMAEKNKISHRGRAMAKLVEWLARQHM